MVNLKANHSILEAVMMPKMSEYLRALLAILLVSMFAAGCAQKKYIQNIDCRSCHMPNSVSGARDFGSIYANPASHHAVGVRYPLGVQAKPNFKLPSIQGADIAFFDRNANGRPDSNEILLFGSNGAVTIECASCHSAHGKSSVPPVDAAGKSHLRIDNAGSALCVTCHNY